MKVFCWGVGLFCVAFGIHVIRWKIRLPEKQTKALLQIFGGTLCLGLIGLFGSAQYSPFMRQLAPEHLAAYLHIALFVISFTLAYIITYSALEADSPSLVMIMTIARAGADGLDKARFEQLMTDERLMLPRIRDLLRDHLAYQDGATYKLTVKGARFVRIFIMYRKMMKLDRKGG